MATNQEILDKLDKLSSSMARLETLVNTEGNRCPYREDISNGAWASEQILPLKDAISDNRVGLAKLSISGGVGGAVVSAVVVFAKWGGWL